MAFPRARWIPAQKARLETFPKILKVKDKQFCERNSLLTSHGLTADKFISLFFRISSPNNFQRKLDLPGGCRRGINRAGSRDRGSASIKNNIIVCRGTEIRVIENIEKLDPKLHVESF